MDREDVALHALEKAIRIEKDGLQFYLQAAERTTDQRGKEIFLSLAHAEEEHLRLVEKQHDSLSKRRGWLAVVEAIGEADWGMPLFPPGREALEKMVRADDSDLDALLLALGFENDSYELYRKGYAETEDPQGKAMYEYLAAMEREHFETLMHNYEHLSRTGSWLGG
ncbi:MAG: ferritin family protein [Anaerolineae bacterium]|nr:ferritin family protein [Anaerolineae bacterium]